ncbi:MAG: hypothetical protein L7H18_00705 [Candidatus Nealsonbacteria bacterium DGGOD1a]|jgi:hypothetical protein|nr:MAG: hypothetical protein L7H18_00705 [Candidatus Nealsonbacteria bacterium DGGOD1a]
MLNFGKKINLFLEFNRRNGRRGIAIYLAAVVLTIILAVALGVSLLSVYQLKSLNEAGASVVAFAAAETGVEWSLTSWISGSYLDTTNYQSACPWDAATSKYICARNIALGDASYTVDASLCGPANEYLCVRSLGSYRNTQRAIRVQM